MLRIVPVEINGFKNGNRKSPCIFKMFHVYSDSGKYITLDNKNYYVAAWDENNQCPFDWRETDIDIDMDIAGNYSLEKVEQHDPSIIFPSLFQKQIRQI